METQIQSPNGHSGPLRGVRVVDVATSRGELAGKFLADLGAEVVKVEPPEGAEARSMPPFSDEEGRSLFWETAGLGKKSVTLDITNGEGVSRFGRLIQDADVLIESFSPGEMDSHGLGFDDLRAANPRLIYVSITPFGQTGPRAHHSATDTTLQAAGGLVSLQGDWDRRPVPIGEPYTAAYHAGAQAAADPVKVTFFDSPLAAQLCLEALTWSALVVRHLGEDNAQDRLRGILERRPRPRQIASVSGLDTLDEIDGLEGAARSFGEAEGWPSLNELHPQINLSVLELVMRERPLRPAACFVAANLLSARVEYIGRIFATDSNGYSRAIAYQDDSYLRPG